MAAPASTLLSIKVSDRTRTGFRLAALVLFAALLATNFYRAATQSIVHDEALTWQFYLSGPASTIFQYYSPNHHFLATILFRISTSLFGQSEFAMRLPTLLSGAWFYWTVFRLCALILGDGWLFLLGCAALTLNPILLDFMVAARGYGLAMAGLFWALYQMLSWFRDRSVGTTDYLLRKRLWKAALGCCIAVATNLTLVMPVFILAITFCVLIAQASERRAPASGPVSPRASTNRKTKKSKPEPGAEPTSPYAPLIHFIVPVVILAVAFLLAAPIDLARSEDFYAGSPTVMKSLTNLTESSFAYGTTSALLSVEHISTNFALIFLPAIALAALIVAFLVSRKSHSMVGRATLLASLAVVGSAVLLIGAHVVSGIPYPENRTGIYFIPLTMLAAFGLVRILGERPGLPRWIGHAIATVLLLAAVEFVAQWNVKSFLVWSYDADTKRVFSALEAAPKPPGQIRLGVSWVFEPALNYYRAVRNATWMAPVERDGFTGTRQFYVVSAADQADPSWSKLKQIYRGPVSGTLVAIPGTAQ